MQKPRGEAVDLSPQESWDEIRSTLDSARSTMYVAGTTTILLFWGVIVSLGLISQYAMETYATGLATSSPWFRAPLWGALVLVGMVGSAVIGHRADSQEADGDAIRSAGIRVFLFWLAIALAAFLVPALAGMWNAEDGSSIPHVSIGIVALGHILFGIMYRPLLAAVGVGIAVAFYVPSYLAGDAAPIITAVAILLLVALGAAWIRKTGVL